LKRRVILRPQAEADIVEARSWYEQRRTGLGREFLDGVQAVLVAVAERPTQYPVVYRDVHRALVRRFPYGIFYVPTGDDIFVVACFHAKRDPALLTDRIR
jgi:plasmid stabilization system protein ParE